MRQETSSLVTKLKHYLFGKFLKISFSNLFLFTTVYQKSVGLKRAAALSQKKFEYPHKSRAFPGWRQWSRYNGTRIPEYSTVYEYVWFLGQILWMCTTARHTEYTAYCYISEYSTVYEYVWFLGHADTVDVHNSQTYRIYSILLYPRVQYCIRICLVSRPDTVDVHNSQTYGIYSILLYLFHF